MKTINRMHKVYLIDFLNRFLVDYPDLDSFLCPKIAKKVFERCVEWSKLHLSFDQRSFLMNFSDKRISLFVQKKPLFFFEQLSPSDQRKIQEFQLILWDRSKILELSQLWSELQFSQLWSRYALSIPPLLRFSQDFSSKSCISAPKDLRY